LWFWSYSWLKISFSSADDSFAFFVSMLMGDWETPTLHSPSQAAGKISGKS
jgi:hypothetical protein